MKFDYKNDYLRAKTEGIISGLSDTKREQEIAVVSTIINLLNNNVYNNIDEFYAVNVDLNAFLERHLKTPITHFGHNETPLTEGDYKVIMSGLKIIAQKKLSINTEDIETTTLDNSKYNSLVIDGKQEIAKNPEGKEIDEALKDAQMSSSDLQTIDVKDNTEKSFQKVQQESKRMNPIPLNLIDENLLNDAQKKLLQTAKKFQETYSIPVSLDINEGILVDASGNIIKLVIVDNSVKVIRNINGVEYEIQDELKMDEEEEDEEKKNEPSGETKGQQMVLSRNYNIEGDVA